jgi:hypothetical protein
LPHCCLGTGAAPRLSIAPPERPAPATAQRSGGTPRGPERMLTPWPQLEPLCVFPRRTIGQPSAPRPERFLCFVRIVLLPHRHRLATLQSRFLNPAPPHLWPIRIQGEPGTVRAFCGSFRWIAPTLAARIILTPGSGFVTENIGASAPSRAQAETTRSSARSRNTTCPSGSAGGSACGGKPEGPRRTRDGCPSRPCWRQYCT